MPIEYVNSAPFVDTAQMREVDRAMVEDYGIALIQMMENAGRNLAHLARSRFLDGDPRGRVVVVLAGRGGNGGGGLVAARRLYNWGAHVVVFTTHATAQFSGVPRQQLAILQRMDVAPHVGDAGVKLPAADLILDALIGYSLDGAPRGAAARLIGAAGGHDAPILSLDAPSGLNTSSGRRYEPSIRATATLTLALPKTGLAGDPYVGELYLADISVPPGLYARPPLNLDVGPLFARGDIVRIS